MLLKRLNSFEDYPEECCRHEEGSCSGAVNPYIGEQDSFGYEVIGFCEKHYQESENEKEPCDGCHALVDRLTYESQTMLMLCPLCYRREVVGE